MFEILLFQISQSVHSYLAHRGFKIIGNADTNAHPTFSSEQYESNEHHLVGYHTDQIEANDGTFLHRLLDLPTDLVRTYQAQDGDPRPIVAIFGLKNAAAAMALSKNGTNSAATVLKQMLIAKHNFELCKGSAISPNVNDLKYKDHKNR
jgi:hypothetical protein